MTTDTATLVAPQAIAPQAAPIVLTFHSDAGHGWYETTAGVLRRFGIAGRVSHFSYRGQGHTVYLEEDCDAALLVGELRTAGLDFIVCEGSTTNGASFIRGLRRYVPTLEDLS